MATRGRRKKFDKDELVQLCLYAIEADEHCVFFVDLYKKIGIDRKTFDTYIPRDSEEFEIIDEALKSNKGQMKKRIRDRLLDMNNPTALICLYKLLGTAEERDALNNHKVKDKDKSEDKDNDIILEIQ